MEDSALGVEETEAEEVPFNLESFSVPLREWIQQETTRSEVKRRFVRCGVWVFACACVCVRVWVCG